MPRELPSAVLFACTMNVVRSPMAEAIMKFLHGRQVYVQSVGIKAGEPDPFAVAVMDEIGIDMSRHVPHTFDQLEDSSFDLVISLSPEAHHTALELTRTNHCEVVFWHIFDATAVEGSREVKLDAYRSVRDELKRRILERFPVSKMPEP